MEARKLSKSQSPPFQLSLRIRHPSMDPGTLSRELMLEAEYSFRAGDARQSLSGLDTTSVHGESYWLGILNPASLPADISFSDDAHSILAQKNLGKAAARSLGWALSLSATRFFRRHSALLERIRREGGEVSLLVALSAVTVGSFNLAPEVSRVFAELGITIEFEFATD